MADHHRELKSRVIPTSMWRRHIGLWREIPPYWPKLAMGDSPIPAIDIRHGRYLTTLLPNQSQLANSCRIMYKDAITRSNNELDCFPRANKINK
jgi:hypothetical protein